MYAFWTVYEALEIEERRLEALEILSYRIKEKEQSFTREKKILEKALISE